MRFNRHTQKKHRQMEAAEVEDAAGNAMAVMFEALDEPVDRGIGFGLCDLFRNKSGQTKQHTHVVHVCFNTFVLICLMRGSN